MGWRTEGFTAYLRDERNLSPHTLRAYEREVARFAAFTETEMGCSGAESASPLTVRAFLAHLHQERLAKVSAQRALAALRTYFRFLGREGWVEANPARAVASPRAPKRLPDVLSAPELADLLDAMPASAVGRRDRAALELLYGAGLRVSELVGLDLDDVDLGQRLARVLGKGGKQRVVPFGRQAEAAIRAYLPDRTAWRHQAAGHEDGEPLFVNQRGGRLTDRSLRRILDAAQGEMLQLQGSLIPLYRLERIYGIGGAKQDLKEAIVVVVEDEERQAGLIIDELVGRQQVVIKSLGQTMKNIPGISGGAIMPDGRVGLILDVGGLLRFATPESRDGLREAPLGSRAQALAA